LKNDTLKLVGEQSGIEKYSTGSSIVERVKYEMKADTLSRQMNVAGGPDETISQKTASVALFQRAAEAIFPSNTD